MTVGERRFARWPARSAAGLSAGAMLWALGVEAARPARAEEPAPPVAAFALIIGVNHSVDADAAVLRYADDDAVRYRDLFRTVGAQTTMLTRLDENTRRLYPREAPDVPPTRAALQSAVAALAAEVAVARDRGRRPVLYLAYAGHGTVNEGRGYIALEDERLGGAELLAQVIDPVGAAETHVIVDACNSFFLVLDRGPGGRRRSLSGFAQLGVLARRPDVGLLLSTSSARESHEWAVFQAGVFSHEVRSGLYGAADADGDGVVSYLELAAFIDRANAAVPNERFRPEMFWRAPAGGGGLLDLRLAPANRIDVSAAQRADHYFLEDAGGVRLADFNSAAGVRLVRPTPEKLYLRRPGDDHEYVLLPSTVPVRIASLGLSESRSLVRGAANDAFQALFSLPFGTAEVLMYRQRADGAISDNGRPVDRRGDPTRVQRWAGAAVGAAGLGLTAGGLLTYLDARSLRNGITAETPQDVAARTNEKVSARNHATAALAGVGAAAIVTGAVLLLWPQSPVDVVTAGPSEWSVALAGRF